MERKPKTDAMLGDGYLLGSKSISFSLLGMLSSIRMRRMTAG